VIGTAHERFSGLVACTWRYSSALRRAIACLSALMAMGGFFSALANGQLTNTSNAFFAQLPTSTTVSPQSGLQLEVDSRWINNFGYRPIRVAVTSPKPTVANHLITIRLYVGFPDVISVEQDFKMPIGTTTARATVACPQFHDRLNYAWDVWIDGVRDPNLSVEMPAGLQVYSTNPSQGPNGNLKFLLLGTPWQSNQTTSPGVGTFDTLMLSPTELPTRWLDYTCFDVVALKPSEIWSIAQSRPEAIVAICRWVRSGGQLWVSQVGNQWEEVADIENQLGLANDSAQYTRKSAQSATAGDAEPSTADPLVQDFADRTPLTDEDVVSRGWKPLKIEAPPPSGVPQGQPEGKHVDKGLPDDSMGSYVQQSLGLGYVRLYRKAWNPTDVAWSLQMLSAATPPNESPPAATPLSVALATTRNWESRHGMAPDAANADFANLLVPGVGLAPVTEFRILITLFALAIGPANYWLLKRWNRPHLMVLTVPIVAVLVTLALFSYAILSDGFGTMVRVRSFTSLDQRTGEAASWARLSYYAGLAPAHGLIFPDDVAVYPIIPGWNETNSQGLSETRREIEWSGGEVRLTQGWMRSRTPTQYLMLRAWKTPLRLVLSPREGKLSAKNELGTAIRFAAVIDGDGKYFAGEGLAEKASAELAPTTWPEIVTKLRTFVTDNLLTVPPELTDESSSYAIMQRRQRRQLYRSQLGLDYSAERLDDNLMSGLIRNLGELSGDTPTDLPPRSFVAITENGPEVVTGIPVAVEHASFHVVVGRW
jgi:hypothetical protein